MYKCCNIKKFIKLLLCDLAIILAACLITAASKNQWTAFNSKKEEAVFVPIIMYHSIKENPGNDSDYAVSPDTVESDLKYLKENGFTSIFVEDIVNYVYNNKPLPQKPVVITADDGFYNNSYYLLPLLEKYDMKATVSVVGYFSEYIAQNDPHVPEYSYLTWDDIKEMNESGRIEFGNHTYNMHSYRERKGCSKLECETEEEYAEKFYEDIGLLQSLMKTNTGIVPTVFTYPYGYISEESIPMIKDMGFSAALNCYEKPNYITHDPDCLFTLNRYNRPENITTEDFMEKLLWHE
ncbi:polysaccharide deacetylase family protein [Porcipelethomonas sp.]|uniref:polysaccharide deacetylase family protein n=1 Tax=Porcipelethomonas sp. TaxID=2981675 RepID=UPI003EF74F7D